MQLNPLPDQICCYCKPTEKNIEFSLNNSFETQTFQFVKTLTIYQDLKDFFEEQKIFEPYVITEIFDFT